MTRSDTIKLQRYLVQQGCEVEVDGIYGPATSRALDFALARAFDNDPPIEAPPPKKPWWVSLAAVPALVAAVSGGLSALGYALDDAQAAQLSTLVESLFVLVLGALSFYGTLRRKAQIDRERIIPGVRYVDQRLRRDTMPTFPKQYQPSGYFEREDRGPFDPGND